MDDPSGVRPKLVLKIGKSESQELEFKPILSGGNSDDEDKKEKKKKKKKKHKKEKDDRKHRSHHDENVDEKAHVLATVPISAEQPPITDAGPTASDDGREKERSADTVAADIATPLAASCSDHKDNAATGADTKPPQTSKPTVGSEDASSTKSTLQVLALAGSEGKVEVVLTDMGCTPPPSQPPGQTPSELDLFLTGGEPTTSMLAACPSLSDDEHSFMLASTNRNTLAALDLPTSSGGGGGGGGDVDITKCLDILDQERGSDELLLGMTALSSCPPPAAAVTPHTPVSQPTADVKQKAQEDVDVESSTPLQQTLHVLVKSVQKNDKREFFALPVTDEIAPGYSAVISCPMDFSTMKLKITQDRYSNLIDFQDDLHLICDNAMRYNLPSTDYFREAKKLKESIRKLMTKDKLKILKRFHRCISELETQHPEMLEALSKKRHRGIASKSVRRSDLSLSPQGVLSPASSSADDEQVHAAADVEKSEEKLQTVAEFAIYATKSALIKESKEDTAPVPLASRELSGEQKEMNSDKLEAGAESEFMSCVDDEVRATLHSLTDKLATETTDLNIKQEDTNNALQSNVQPTVTNTSRQEVVTQISTSTRESRAREKKALWMPYKLDVESSKTRAADSMPSVRDQVKSDVDVFTATTATDINDAAVCGDKLTTTICHGMPTTPETKTAYNREHTKREQPKIIDESSSNKSADTSRPNLTAVEQPRALDLSTADVAASPAVDAKEIDSSLILTEDMNTDVTTDVNSSIEHIITSVERDNIQSSQSVEDSVIDESAESETLGAQITELANRQGRDKLEVKSVHVSQDSGQDMESTKDYVSTASELSVVPECDVKCSGTDDSEAAPSHINNSVLNSIAPTELSAQSEYHSTDDVNIELNTIKAEPHDAPETCSDNKSTNVDDYQKSECNTLHAMGSVTVSLNKVMTDEMSERGNVDAENIVRKTSTSLDPNRKKEMPVSSLKQYPLRRSRRRAGTDDNSSEATGNDNADNGVDYAVLSGKKRRATSGSGISAGGPKSPKSSLTEQSQIRSNSKRKRTVSTPEMLPDASGADDGGERKGVASEAAAAGNRVLRRSRRRRHSSTENSHRSTARAMGKHSDSSLTAPHVMVERITDADLETLGKSEYTSPRQTLLKGDSASKIVGIGSDDSYSKSNMFPQRTCGESEGIVDVHDVSAKLGLRDTDTSDTTEEISVKSMPPVCEETKQTCSSEIGVTQSDTELSTLLTLTTLLDTCEFIEEVVMSIDAAITNAEYAFYHGYNMADASCAASYNSQAFTTTGTYANNNVYNMNQQTTYGSAPLYYDHTMFSPPSSMGAPYYTEPPEYAAAVHMYQEPETAAAPSPRPYVLPLRTSPTLLPKPSKYLLKTIFNKRRHVGKQKGMAKVGRPPKHKFPKAASQTLMKPLPAKKKKKKKNNNKFEGFPDRMNAEDILEQVRYASDDAAYRLHQVNPHSKMGYLKQEIDGSLTFNPLNTSSYSSKKPAADEARPVLEIDSYPFNIPPDHGKIYSRSQLPYVKELTDGVSTDFKPIFDDTWLYLTEEEQRKLIAAYGGDGTGFSYAQSLRSFVAGSSEDTVKMVDNLLDILSDGQHSEILNDVEKRKASEEERAMQYRLRTWPNDAYAKYKDVLNEMSGMLDAEPEKLCSMNVQELASAQPTAFLAHLHILTTDEPYLSKPITAAAAQWQVSPPPAGGAGGAGWEQQTTQGECRNQQNGSTTATPATCSTDDV